MHTPIRRASKLRWQNDRFHLPFINPILSPAKPRKKQTTKTKLSLASLALLGALHFATPPLRAQDGSDRVHIDVRVAADQDRKDIKGSSADTVTQNKTLEITITGKPKNPETRTGKWTVYGRSVSGHDLTAVVQARAAGDGPPEDRLAKGLRDLHPGARRQLRHRHADQSEESGRHRDEIRGLQRGGERRREGRGRSRRTDGHRQGGGQMSAGTPHLPRSDVAQNSVPMNPRRCQLRWSPPAVPRRNA